jgi:hypothetical protein
MTNATTNETATRYITRKDCPCGAGRTSALLVGRNIARSAAEGPVFHGDTATCYGDICIVCRGCGRNRGAEMIRGKVSHKHECGAKCLASKGPTCECSCGGKNHGASYSAVAA